MSRFVPAGAGDGSSERDGEWARAHEEIETKRRENAEIGRQEGGKSLYETLQANKAAKQEAFEESIRLKNQFRSLDEDEVEFLDSVLESTRAKEAEVRKETREQLESYRQQREEAERLARTAAPSEPAEPVETNWTVGPRRKRKAKDDVLGGAKLRKTSSTEKPPEVAEVSTGFSPIKSPDESARSARSPEAVASAATAGSPRQDPVPADKPKPSSPTIGLGLGAYSSDDSD